MLVAVSALASMKAMPWVDGLRRRPGGGRAVGAS
jgi:hypothetical protein